jgi:hypothetical protein
MQIIKWYLISGYMYILRRQGEVASFFLSLRQYDHQVTSVASNITWGQELFRLVCHMLKSHKVSYVPITAITSNPTVLVYHFYRNEAALKL